MYLVDEWVRGRPVGTSHRRNGFIDISLVHLTVERVHGRYVGTSWVGWVEGERRRGVRERGRGEGRIGIVIKHETLTSKW